MGRRGEEKMRSASLNQSSPILDSLSRNSLPVIIDGITAPEGAALYNRKAEIGPLNVINK
jgi:hypothetical protein